MTEPIFERFLASQGLSFEVCFLCGVTLDKDNRTKEHVIPFWAQKRFSLGHQSLTLINGTTIPYRKLVIPCCFDCNNRHLRPLEDAVSEAVTIGPDAVRALGRTLTIWLAKIFYGLLHRSLSLPQSRRHPAEGTITDPELLKQLRFIYTMLHGVRHPVVFDPSLSSIMVYETQVPRLPQQQWHFADNTSGLTITMRMGNVGILASLLDGGGQQPLMDTMLPKLPQPLHPLQHLEMAAKVCHMSTLLTRPPTLLYAEDPTGVHISLLGGVSYEPWDAESYAHVLALFTGCKIEDIYSRDESAARSFLWNSDGTSRSIRLDDTAATANSAEKS